MSDQITVLAGKSIPSRLTMIEDPPKKLWMRGELPVGPMIGVVGTRKATRYGMVLAKAMGSAIARAGWTVVSGLARGIDGAAHQGCLQGAGKGVAVLGSGVDVWYPREHETLGLALVASGGAVLSEYEPGVGPEPWRFPARNRIISGLSAAVVVVEAAERGGALITARLAAEQGRDVFVVPGDVDRETSRGCNLLIRDGAIPVLGADDLIEGLSLIVGPPATDRPERADLSLRIPSSGASIESVVEINGGDTPAVLVELGRLEAGGLVQITDGYVTRS